MMFSLEMALTPTADRLLSCRTEIPYIDFVRAKDESVFDDVQVRFEEERIALNKHPNFRICENASLSLNDIKKHVKKFQADIGQQYCIVIIDLLSMVADFSSLKGSANFSQVAEVGVNKFSAMCKELGIHGIGIVQLNRSNEIESVRKVEDLVKFRPSRSQVKNSAAYLERARWLIGMYRKKFWAEQCLEKEDYEDMEDIIEVITLKQSNGPLSSVEALFDGQTFSVLAIEDTVKEEQTDAIV
jgi:replicative DNA helicase